MMAATSVYVVECNGTVLDLLQMLLFKGIIENT